MASPSRLTSLSFHLQGVAENRRRQGQHGYLQRSSTSADQGFWALITSYARVQKAAYHPQRRRSRGLCRYCSAKMNPAINYRNGTLPIPGVHRGRVQSLIGELLQDRHAVNLLAMLELVVRILEDKDYFEGFRSLTTNGIDKPILNVFRMFNLMSGNRVGTISSGRDSMETLISTGVRQMPDVDAFATYGDPHEAAVLVWNYHDVDGAAEPATATVTITGIPAARTWWGIAGSTTGSMRPIAMPMIAWPRDGFAAASPQRVNTPTPKTAGPTAASYVAPQWVDTANGRMLDRNEHTCGKPYP